MLLCHLQLYKITIIALTVTVKYPIRKLYNLLLHLFLCSYSPLVDFQTSSILRKSLSFTLHLQQNNSKLGNSTFVHFLKLIIIAEMKYETNNNTFRNTLLRYMAAYSCLLFYRLTGHKGAHSKLLLLTTTGGGTALLLVAISLPSYWHIGLITHIWLNHKLFLCARLYPRVSVVQHNGTLTILVAGVPSFLVWPSQSGLILRPNRVKQRLDKLSEMLIFIK